MTPSGKSPFGKTSIAKKLLLRFMFALGIVLLLAPGAVQTARAVEYDNDGVIEAGEVVDDDIFLESASGIVVVDGIVNGTLIAHGNEVIINGQVNGNILANTQHGVINGKVVGSIAFSGRELEVNGTVDGTIAFTGGSLVIGPEAEVTRNIFFTGYSFETLPGSRIGKDIQANGFQALLRGDSGRDVNGELIALQVEGSVGRDINITVDPPENNRAAPPFGDFTDAFGLPFPAPAGLVVSEDARIGGKLKYTSTVDQAQAIHIQPEGGVVFIEKVVAQKSLGTRAVEWVGSTIRSLVTLLILGGLVLWKAPKALERAARESKRPLQAALSGFLAIFLGFPLLLMVIIAMVILGIILAMASLGDLALSIFSGGLPFVGTAFTLFMLLVSYGSKLVFSYAASQWFFRRYFPHVSVQAFWVLAAGVLVYLLLRSVPVAGLLLGLAATLIGLGAIWLAYKHRHAALGEPGEPALNGAR